MIKLVGLYKRKPGMTPDEFRSYYEQHHAPLVMELLPQVRRYRRSYMTEQYLTNTFAEPTWFDVIQETWFESLEQYEELLKMLQDPTLTRLIADDEAKFMDLSARQMFIMEEYVSG